MACAVMVGDRRPASRLLLLTLFLILTWTSGGLLLVPAHHRSSCRLPVCPRPGARALPSLTVRRAANDEDKKGQQTVKDLNLEEMFEASAHSALRGGVAGVKGEGGVEGRKLIGGGTGGRVRPTPACCSAARSAAQGFRGGGGSRRHQRPRCWYTRDFNQ